MTDEELIQGILNRDDKAIEYMVKEYENKIFRLARQYVRTDEEAYDIMQDVFITVLEKVQNFRQESKFSTWLYSVTAFTAIGHIRKKKRKNETSIDEMAHKLQIEPDHIINRKAFRESAWHNPLENKALQKESEEVLMKAIADLPSDYRTLFILKELEGLSIAEIQETVPLSVPAIKTRLHRARLYLRKQLADYFHEFNS